MYNLYHKKILQILIYHEFLCINMKKNSFIFFMWLTLTLTLASYLENPVFGSTESGLCYPPTYEETIDQGEVIISGEVLSKKSTMQEYTNLVEFRIHESVRGGYEGIINVTTSEQRMLSSEPIGGDPFHVGEEYLIVAKRLENDVLYADAHCGNWLVIPISEGLYNVKGSQNCKATVHLECLKRCENADRHPRSLDEPCIVECYAENVNHCVSQSKNDSDTTISQVPPPKQQIKSGVKPIDVTCKEGLELIFKSSDNSPACVKLETKEKLIERGWGTISFS